MSFVKSTWRDLHVRARQSGARVAAFWRLHEPRLVLTTGLLLVALAAFGAGIMTSDVWQNAPLIIEHAAATTEPPGAAVPAAPAAVAATPADCAFVGSRNSTKYYPPTCSFAARIAPENLRCFVSAEDAEAKGYVRSTGC